MISITEYNNTYQQQVIDLILPIQQQEFQVKVSIEDQPDLLNIESFYQSKGNFWVALHNNNVVGTISLIDIGNGQSALRKMFVQKEYRGQPFGVAQQLLDILIQWAENQQLKELFLGTIDFFTAAQKFYIKNGFIEIPKQLLPETFPLMPVDNRFYMRSL